jgi:AcrR family transcriptional regulator
MPSRRRLTREIVVRTAACMQDQNPSQELTMKDLAAELGVRTPSLYNHIGSLDELRQEIAIYGVHELADRLGNAAIGRAGDDALQAMSWAYRDFVTTRPGLHQATQRAPRPDQTELMAGAERALAMLQRVLEPYGLSEKEQIHAIRALRAMVHGFVSLEQAGGFGMPVDLDESFQYLVDMYVTQVNNQLVQQLPIRPGSE